MFGSSQPAEWLLPAFAGPHQVGTRLVETPLPKAKRIELPYCPRTRTLKYRVFYPTDATDGARAVWASAEQVAGFASFAGVPSLTGLLHRTFGYMLSGIHIRAIEDAEYKAGKRRWPVVIFSHGLGGTDTLYSTLCGSLASYGMVVFAIEHRDHSASSTIIREDGVQDEHIEYISPVDQEDPELRRRARYMLAQRNYELRMLGKEIHALEGDLADVLDLDHVSIVGHSFGAATTCHFLHSLDKGLSIKDLNEQVIELGDTTFPFDLNAAILLDIWTQPIDDHITLPDSIPVLNLVSAQFSVWPANHDGLQQLVTRRSTRESDNMAQEQVDFGLKHGEEVVIVQDSLHLSQCDAGLMFPTLVATLSGYKRAADDIMRENIDRCIDFFHRHDALPLDGDKIDLSLWSGSVASPAFASKGSVPSTAGLVASESEAQVKDAREPASRASLGAGRRSGQSQPQLVLTNADGPRAFRPRLLPRSSQSHGLTHKPPSWLRRFLQSVLLY